MLNSVRYGSRNPLMLRIAASLMLLLATSWGGVLLNAQNITVKGTILDAKTSEPIPFASVVLKGGKLVGTSSDVDGAYVLSVPADGTLVFSSIGYDNLELAVNGRAVINVELQPTVDILSESVVVAYGTATKSSLTGAITSVNSEKIDQRPVASAVSALEGTVSGAIINSSVGDPTSEPKIYIRGIGTVNGSTSPLYVVDGVPFGGNMSDINPSDIESISVLKDAASCALYGNRASNGVILITTKKGKGGKASFDFKASVGAYTRGTKEYDRLGPKEWMEAYYENVKNGLMSSGTGLSLAEATDEVQNNLISKYLYTNIFNKPENQLFDANGKLTAGTEILSGYLDDLDWYDQAIRVGKREEYVFSGSASSDMGNYYFSLGYLNNEGYVHNSGLERLSGRLNVNITPKKWISAGVNLNVTHQNSLNSSGATTDNGSSFTNVFMYARQIAPIYPVHLHDENGAYILDANGNKQYDGGVGTRNQYVDRHVIWENELDKDTSVRNTMNAVAYTDIKFLNDFTFTIKGNLNVRSDKERTYDNSIIGNGSGSGGRTKQENYDYKNWTFQQLLRWDREFGDHSVEALVGHENYSDMYDYTYAFKIGEVFFGKDHLSNFSEISTLNGYAHFYRTESYLARARYNYKNRYNVEASWRRDGSSRFHKDSRWGNFGSLGVNWVISEEEFMKDARNWMDYMKLRADWGQVGNDAGAGRYAYMSLYSNSTYNDQGSYYLSQNAANELQWETGESWGIAVDARLFNRWNITAEYYNKLNKDLLFDVYQPLSAGATSTSYAESVTTANLGTIANSGIEIETDIDVINTRDWKVNIGANFTTLKNRVTKLPEQNKDGIQSGSYKIVEGKSRYEYYVYTWAGVDQMTGNSLYKADLDEYHYVVNGEKIGNADKADITNDVTVINGEPYVNKTTYAKREFHGQALPKAYGSFSLNTSWKGLSLSTIFTYSLGGKTMDGIYNSLLSASSTTASSYHSDILKAWKEVPAGMTETSADRINPTGFPRIDYSNTYNNATSSRFLTSKNYFIFKNINLSYSLPRNLVKKLDLSAISLNAACENVFIKTARQGLNSQQGGLAGGQSNANVPARTFTGGINIKF